MVARRGLRVTLGRRAPVVAAAAVVAAVAAFAGWLAFAPRASAEVVVAQGDQSLPSATLTDWATYGDHLVLATVTGERRLAPSAEEQAAGEGFIPRVIDLRIDQVAWSRDGAPTPPTAFSTDLDGWTFHEDQEQPLRMEGEPMLVVGHAYLLVITWLPATADTSAGWAALAPDAIIPAQGGVVGAGDAPVTLDGRTLELAWTSFEGGSVDAVAAALRATSPDPDATAPETWALDPVARFRAVAAGGAGG